MNAAPINRFHDQHLFLSNFYVTKRPFYVPRLDAKVRTAEHAFMALKTSVPHERAAVLAAPTPATAKKIGRTVTLVHGWDDIRGDAMRHVLDAKFAPGTPELTFLIATGHRELIEGNLWHDQTWGQCLCVQHAGTPGNNLLGKTLMNVRASAQEHVNARNQAH